jgi:hypothetical protein
LSVATLLLRISCLPFKSVIALLKFVLSCVISLDHGSVATLSVSAVLASLTLFKALSTSVCAVFTAVCAVETGVLELFNSIS